MKKGLKLQLHLLIVLLLLGFLTYFNAAAFTFQKKQQQQQGGKKEKTQDWQQSASSPSSIDVDEKTRWRIDFEGFRFKAIATALASVGTAQVFYANADKLPNIADKLPKIWEKVTAYGITPLHFLLSFGGSFAGIYLADNYECFEVHAFHAYSWIIVSM